MAERREVGGGLVVAAAAVAALAIRAALRASRRFELRGKTVLVTGGSRGLGLVLAREFAAQGARVAICARDAGPLERARAELAAAGAEVVAVPCDITSQAEVADLVATVAERLGPVDVLVNNAGVIQVGPWEEMTVGDYDEAMRTHFWAPLYLTLAVLPAMRARRAGRIVNISSIGGKISVPHLLPYSASKFALTGLSEGLRGAVAEDGVLVTTVIPGLMRTGSPRNAFFKGRNEEEYAWFSVADSLPGLSADARRAARQIVSACQHGQAELILPLLAKVQVKLNGLFPGFGADVMGLLERALPEPGGIGQERRYGRESESAAAPSWLTAPSDRAAEQNNQLVERPG